MKKTILAMMLTGAVSIFNLAAAENNTVWNFKMESRLEYYGNNDFPAWATMADDAGRKVLMIQNDDAKKNNCLVKYFTKEEFARIKGKKITCSVMVKGEKITGKGCGKFMLMVHLPDNKADWPDANIGKESFDWREVKFTYDMPYLASAAAMVIGIQEASGTIWYKDMKITVSED